MIKLIALVALVVAIYVCAKYVQQGPSENGVKPFDPVAINIVSLKARQQIYVPVNLESHTRNGHRNIRTILKIRNTSSTDSAYLTRIDYYDTQGLLIKEFLEAAILVKPMATKEIVVKNNQFQTKGDNFLVHWHSNDPAHSPFVQTVSLDVANRVLTVEHGIITSNSTEE
jgi:hypothetical protein